VIPSFQEDPLNLSYIMVDARKVSLSKPAITGIYTKDIILGIVVFLGYQWGEPTSRYPGNSSLR
jgi:hypothetical protein